VVVLDILDDFPFMDPKLVALLQQAVPPVLEACRRRVRIGIGLA
jgi:predicted protein tyrosine phosphatase